MRNWRRFKALRWNTGREWEYGRRAQIWVVLSLVSWKCPLSHQTDFGPVTLCCSTWLRFWFGSVLQGVHKNSTGTITNDLRGGGRVQKTPAWVIKTAPGWKIGFKQTTWFSQHFLWPWDSNIKEGKNSYKLLYVCTTANQSWLWPLFCDLSKKAEERMFTSIQQQKTQNIRWG